MGLNGKLAAKMFHLAEQAGKKVPRAASKRRGEIRAVSCQQAGWRQFPAR
jgi:hypothetical protein